nr:class I SAM-dependent methyltransferase [Chloroflexota bacterium]
MTEQALRVNQQLWDEWTRVHETSSFYDLEGFRRGGIRLRPYEIEEIGDVTGRDLLHLQCHFGIDTLSWARLGARVTGADFSPAAIELAIRLAGELKLDARFVRSDLYDLPDALEGEFDIVYTSRGVLGWLPDISRWARVVSHFLKPGGTFYITEIHPVAQAFENEGVAAGELRLQYPYWEHAEPLAFDVAGSYADRSAAIKTRTEYGWDHGLGEILTALIDAGLR